MRLTGPRGKASAFLCPKHKHTVTHRLALSTSFLLSSLLSHANMQSYMNKKVENRYSKKIFVLQLIPQCFHCEIPTGRLWVVAVYCTSLQPVQKLCFFFSYNLTCNMFLWAPVQYPCAQCWRTFDLLSLRIYPCLHSGQFLIEYKLYHFPCNHTDTWQVYFITCTKWIN